MSWKSCSVLLVVSSFMVKTKKLDLCITRNTVQARVVAGRGFFSALAGGGGWVAGLRNLWRNKRTDHQWLVEPTNVARSRYRGVSSYALCPSLWHAVYRVVVAFFGVSSILLKSLKNRNKESSKKQRKDNSWGAVEEYVSRNWFDVLSPGELKDWCDRKVLENYLEVTCAVEWGEAEKGIPKFHSYGMSERRIL